ncbi:MAG: hypothetical protein ACM3ME_08170 [Chloroflexota bacterium]
MMNLRKLIIGFCLIGLISCDPTHSIQLENRTGKKIQILYHTESDVRVPNPSDLKTIKLNGINYDYITLDSAEIITIGHVIARYTPRPEDISIDRLEIRIESDTLRFIGKRAIFSMVNKQSRLDWRLIIN